MKHFGFRDYLLLVLPTLLAAAALETQVPIGYSTRVTVVNMIPFSMSSESHQDSEPSLAVNPANPLQIAASAFTPISAGDQAQTITQVLRDDLGFNAGPEGFGPIVQLEEIEAPAYVSTDGGLHWRLNPIVPHGNSVTGTFDMTLSFSDAGVLYAGVLRGDSGWKGTECLSGTPPPLPEEEVFVKTQENCFPEHGPRMIIARTSDFSVDQLMESFIDREFVDQPHVEAVTVPTGPDRGRDRVFLGNNDLNFSPSLFPFLADISGRTASVDRSLDATSALTIFAPVVVESTITTGQDGPAVRVAVAAAATSRDGKPTCADLRGLSGATSSWRTCRRRSRPIRACPT